MTSHTIEMKVVLNKCYGGFGLSRVGMRRLIELGFEPVRGDMDYLRTALGDNVSGYFNYDPCNLKRHDPRLVQVVEELGDAANGDGARLSVETVYVGYSIDNYDGRERLE